MPLWMLLCVVSDHVGLVGLAGVDGKGVFGILSHSGYLLVSLFLDAFGLFLERLGCSFCIRVSRWTARFRFRFNDMGN